MDEINDLRQVDREWTQDVRIVVTGAAGYVGSHVVGALNRCGVKAESILAVDDLSRGYPELPRGLCQSTRADVRDGHEMFRLLKSWRPTVVVHLAGLRDARESSVQPGRYYSVNVEGTNSLASVCSELGSVRGMVFASSCSVYGSTDSPVNEDSPIAPISPYARSKAAAEALLRDHSAAGGVAPVILRFFNAAGAQPPGRPDTRSKGILAALATSARLGQPFPLLGNDRKTPDGTCIRDYVHVADIATAHVQVCKMLAADCSPHFVEYNIGPGTSASVLQVIEAFTRVTRRGIEIDVQPSAAADPDLVTGDYSRFEHEFGVRRPRSLDEIVASGLPDGYPTGRTAHEASPGIQRRYFKDGERNPND